MTCRTHASIVVVLISIGCAGAPRAPSQGAPLVRLIRGSCDGACPEYEVSVYGDGRVDFVGVSRTAKSGRHTWHLAPSQLESLHREIDAARRASYSSRYDAIDCADYPTVTTEIHEGAFAKVVAHYRGDEGAPPALAAFEDALDRLIGTEPWIGLRVGDMGPVDPTCHR